MILLPTVGISKLNQQHQQQSH